MEVVAGLVALGLFAGGLTTLAGLGGGLMMTLAMAAFVGPTEALATAAPALLLGNSHRVYLYRAHLGRRATEPSSWLFVAGAVPGALIGGVLVLALPELVLQVLLVGAALLAVARQMELFQWRPGPRAAVPGAFGAGLVTATSGGGGLLLGPLLLASGFTAERFVVTASLVAGSVHVARLAAYGAGGLVHWNTLGHAAVRGDSRRQPTRAAGTQCDRRKTRHAADLRRALRLPGPLAGRPTLKRPTRVAPLDHLLERSVAHRHLSRLRERRHLTDRCQD